MVTLEKTAETQETKTNWGPFSVYGKNVLVTGAAKGIGRGITNLLVEGGANVLVADVDLNAANKTVEELSSEVGEARPIRLDVTSEKDITGAIEHCVHTYGSLDVLVNNAGVYPTKPVLEMTPEFFDKVMAVNLRGLVFLSKAAAQQMIKQKTGGKIINIASIDSVHPTSLGLAAYDTSKGGVLSFTKSFALEMAPHGVTVNVVAPGAIATEGSSDAFAYLREEQKEEMTKELLARVPLHRMGVPDDIAKVTTFLASGASDYMTGTFLIVDGGMLLS